MTASAISAVTRLTLAAALALGACSGRPASYLPGGCGRVSVTLTVGGDPEAAVDLVHRRIGALAETGRVTIVDASVRIIDGDSLNATVILAFGPRCDGTGSQREAVVDAFARSTSVTFHRCGDADAVAAVLAELGAALGGARVVADPGATGGIDVWPAAGVDPVAALAGRPLPDGVRVLREPLSDPADPGRQRLWVLLDPPAVGSDAIARATQQQDELGRPGVMIDLDATGAAAFATLTAESVGRPVAIVINGEVRMAPVVREAITGGRLRIDLGAAKTPAAQLAEARDLALALSAGRLAVREGAGAVSEICVGPR